MLKGGSILVRQRGTKFYNGINVGMGGDYTLFAKKTGYVKFRCFGIKKRKYIFVL